MFVCYDLITVCVFLRIVMRLYVLFRVFYVFYIIYSCYNCTSVCDWLACNKCNLLTCNLLACL